jgi:hypothetical protein
MSAAVCHPGSAVSAEILTPMQDGSAESRTYPCEYLFQLYASRESDHYHASVRRVDFSLLVDSDIMHPTQPEITATAIHH